MLHRALIQEPIFYTNKIYPGITVSKKYETLQWR
jgi:hypothetical protein